MSIENKRREFLIRIPEGMFINKDHLITDVSTAPIDKYDVHVIEYDASRDDFTNDQLKAELDEQRKYWTKFRQEIRQILNDKGIGSNPGWTEENILDALKILSKVDASREKAIEQLVTAAKKVNEHVKNEKTYTGNHGQHIRVLEYMDLTEALAAFEKVR